MTARRTLLLAAAAALAAAGCGDYKHRTAAARSAFYAGQFDRSARLYRRDGRGAGRNRLLYLLDAGMALHAAGRHEESNRCFLEADGLIERLNFSDLGETAASIVLDDRAATYRGEEFEDVLVNVFAALNFLLSGSPRGPEEALVECRRLDWKLRVFSERRGRKYLQNAFARYLSGVAYELDGEPNDAYIDYKLVHKLRPGFEPVRRDLLRLAHRLGFRDDLERWEKKFGVKYDPAAEAGTGEVVVVLELGRAPEKFPRDELLDLPVYVPYPPEHAGALLTREGRVLGSTEGLEDIAATAVKTLDDRMGPTVARRMAGLALKTGAAVAVRQAVKKKTKDRGLADLAGWLLWWILVESDQADTRSWLTLPAGLQVARARLPAGTHHLALELVGPDGRSAGRTVDFPGVEVRRGRITLLVTRALR